MSRDGAERAGPRRPSMRAQAAAVIVATFLLSHLAGVLFYAFERRGAIEMTEALDLVERAAGLSRLLRELPADWKPSLVRASDSRAFRIWVTAEPALPRREASAAEQEIEAHLRAQLPRLSVADFRVRLVTDERDRLAPPPPDPAGRLGALTAFWEGAYPLPALVLSIPHAETEWVNVLGLIDTPESLVPELLLANLVSAVVGIALVAFWLVDRVTAPLGRLAAAAERLGRDISAPPLPEGGPREVAVAAAAFNSMQRRLLRLIRGRTELLAGVSHDLRTPLTQLRLRLELMPESPEREKGLRTLDEMDGIIGTFLAYARASGEAEERRRTDLGALVASLCDDLADLGAPIACEAGPGLVVPCKPIAVRRAVTNLVENAVRHAGGARVRVSRAGGRAVVAVEDRGPGIPEAQLDAVLMPFHRAEPARTRAPGGVGLGLGIAQAIAEDHGGELRLSNRSGGGLRAILALPL
jgi:signal transduction histidine kinase